MKKKVLLSSIATIALCLCLIAGSTFALFTASVPFNIAVTAANVELTAELVGLVRSSVQPDANAVGGYAYEDNLANFANGGTATYANGILTLDRITPGDKVSFTIQGTNESNVIVKYRFVVKCQDDASKALMRGLKITIGNQEYTGLDSYTSAWTTLTDRRALDNINVTIELPVDAGNEYQNKVANISIQLEAIQGNAGVNNNGASVVTLPQTTAAATTTATPNP